MTTETVAAAPRQTLADYRWSRPFPTRWQDDDVFGHLNNTVYYSAMDTTVTAWLLGPGGFALQRGGEMAFVVASSCRYVESGAFPDVLTMGLRADRVGRTSIAWGLGVFRESDARLLATGSFVHVFVDRESRRPVPVPDALRARVAADLTPPDPEP